MGMTRDGDRWKITVRIRAGGRIVQRRDTFTGTKEQARKRLQAMKDEARATVPGSLIDTSRIRTFAGLLDLYEAKRGPFCGGHASRIHTLRGVLGDVPLDAVPERFDRYLMMLRSGKSARTGKLLSNVHLNRITEIVRAAFQVACDSGALTANPITRARFPRLLETPRNVALSPADELRLMNTVREHAPHLAPFIEFSLAVPSRKTELLTARRGQVDLIGNTLMIPATTAKARRPILKPLPPFMLPYFRAGIPPESEYVFWRRENGAYHPLGDIRKSFGTCTRLAGLPWLRVHDLRHVAASKLASRGVPEVAINAVAGWSNNSGMLSRYFGETPARVLGLVFGETGAKCEPEREPVEAFAG